MKKLVESIKAVMSSEQIQDLPEIPSARQGSGVFRMIFAREKLPPAETLPKSGKPSFTSWLLAPEILPRGDAQVRSGRPSFLSMLFARESLPRDSNPENPTGKERRE